jgi:peptidoglycan/LPS O-acetylase OafA/YrhL
MHVAISSDDFGAAAIRGKSRPDKPAKNSPAGTNVARNWPLLDVVRIVAALLVVSGHVRFLYFGTLADAGHSDIASRVFQFATGISQEAVVLFFVVSGFLVGGPAARLIESGKFDPWSYLINRFVRIYIVFVPCLALAWALNWFSAAAFAGTNPHADLLEGWSDFDLPCFLAGLQGVMCPAHADPPLWSLGYEWLAYLLAPMVFYILFSAFDRTLKTAALALYLVMVHTLLPAGFMWAWLLYWFIGTLAYRLLTSWRLPLYAGLTGLGVVLIGCLATRTHVVPVFFVRIMIALGLALAIGCRPLMSGPWLGNARLTHAAAYLAGFSYSLYATHLPVAVAFARLLEWSGQSGLRPGPGLPADLAFVLTIAVTVAAAVAFASVTEKHTGGVRRSILRHRYLRNPALKNA